MSACDTVLSVAVGVLRDTKGRVLISRRRAGTHLAGLWEFPGGKREAGESRWQALARELHEELGVRALDGHPLIRLTHQYPDRRVELDVWTVSSWEGTATSVEGQALAWVSPMELPSRDMPAADLPIVSAIALPPLYLITPDVDLRAGVAFLETLERSLDGVSALVQLRCKRAFETSSDEAAFVNLAHSAIALVHRAGAQVLLNLPKTVSADARTQLIAAADGVHLTREQIENGVPVERQTTDGASRSLPRSLPRSLIGASCHDRAELAAAARAGADFAVLSPVQRTASHPQAKPLGWPVFADLVRDAKIPVYGLGGMTPTDLGAARWCGAQGVAAIRGLWREA
jgi:8-oxo-dGTP diphosphatase